MELPFWNDCLSHLHQPDFTYILHMLGNKGAPSAASFLELLKIYTPFKFPVSQSRQVGTPDLRNKNGEIEETFEHFEELITFRTFGKLSLVLVVKTQTANQMQESNSYRMCCMERRKHFQGVQLKCARLFRPLQPDARTACPPVVTTDAQSKGSWEADVPMLIRHHFYGLVTICTEIPIVVPAQNNSYHSTIYSCYTGGRW